MKLITTTLALFLFFLCASQAQEHVSDNAQVNGIVFMHDDFEGAVAKAKAEHKKVFIDFYAVWCAPCKMMSKYVFTDSILGDYFDSHFIALKMNTELPKNKQVVEKYQVSSMPCLMFIDTDTAGSIIGRNNGSMETNDFLNMSKVAAGEVLGFEAIYKQYKANPKDLVLMQRVLESAPAFVTAQEGMEKQKWILRVEKIYNTYVSQKMGPDFINKRDYRLILKYNESAKEEGDKVLDFMVKNIDAYLTNVGKAPAYYIIQTNEAKAKDLAKKGDLKYQAQLDRITGDMAPAYAISPKYKLSAYEMSKASCDALYALWKQKDVDKYIKIKSDYFAAMDTSISPLEKASAAQDMLYAASKKLNDAQRNVVKQWIMESLESHQPIPLMQRVNILVLLGDINRDLKNIGEAKKAYNQAYAESLQLKEEQVQKMIQYQVKRKIELLKLE